MSTQLRRQALVSVPLGALTGALAVVPARHTQGIAMPAEYSRWIEAWGAAGLDRLLWDAAVAYGSSLGLISLLVLLLLFRFALAPRLPAALLFGLGVLLASHALLPSLHGAGWPGAWWQLGRELAVLIGCLLAWQSASAERRIRLGRR